MSIGWRLRRALRPVLRPLRDWQAPRIHRWMLHEASVPMQLTNQRALIVAPHHDDETFGCGGLIAMKRQAGIDVSIVILTDGRQSHGHVAGVDPEQVVKTRREEALAAVHELGVPPTMVNFLNLPDQGMSSLAAEVEHDATVRLSDLLRSFQPGEVYVNCQYDNHPDHEAAFRLIKQALKQSGLSPALYQYPIWLVWKGHARATLRPPELAGGLRLDVRSVQAQKDAAIAIYRSQLPVLPNGFVSQFQQGYELFFRTT